MADAQEGINFEWSRDESSTNFEFNGPKITKKGYGVSSAVSATFERYDPNQALIIQYTIKVSRTQNNNIRIGFISHDELYDDFTAKVKGSKMYAIDGQAGHISSHKTNFSFQAWNSDAFIESGDEIMIELSFITRTIKLWKNNKLIGTMFERIDIDRNCKYRLAVALKSAKDSVTVTSYQRIEATMASYDTILATEYEMENKNNDNGYNLGINDNNNNNDSKIDMGKSNSLLQGNNNVRKKKKFGCFHFIDIILNFFVFWYCLGKCCCCKGNKSRKLKQSRSILYSGFTFSYCWLYFIGAIFMVPYASQMALNSLATATAVTIFIKRKELLLHHFRTITGFFLPLVIFMSAYAVWNQRDTISQDVIDNSPEIERFALGVFIAVINGTWIVLCTFYIAAIEDEVALFDIFYVTKDKQGRIVSKIKVDSFVTRRFGNKIGNRLGSVISLTHIIFGFMYVSLCVLFIRVNELFILELVLYIMCLILGAVCFEYFFLKGSHDKKSKLNNGKPISREEQESYKYNLISIEVCTQLFIFCLGISGTRILYALLGGLDFTYIFDLPVKIVAATFLCWGVLFYRTLEVIEWNINSAEYNEGTRRATIEKRLSHNF